MQGNIIDSMCSLDTEEIITPKNLYLWAAAHTRLCQEYVSVRDEKTREELDNKINTSLNQGKALLNTLNNQIQSHRKSLIPASGIHRFSQPKEGFFNPKELSNKNHYSFKCDLVAPNNVKSIPMPSRTYLKKKPPTQ